MKTPYFMIKENELSKNISQFKEALKKEWSNSQLSYSVKTNSLPWLLNYMNENDVMAEVVSDEEYLLARKCGYNDDRIVFNGIQKILDMRKTDLDLAFLMKAEN